ncbi:MAG: hypothetical protein GF317_02040 [Candidatus Lokiarchaeota archaeon]|nr:hypothetical protein [Candidatus Lokiarchaeota archaeon]MBD3198720.1 hypothetical protein [Candidatus Lokiarchaeota archaeon]
MTETKRTTVTLSKTYMDLIEDLIGVYGRTQAAVISNIVQHFFNNSSNFPLLEELRSRKKKKPDKKDIELKIQKVLKGVKSIQLDHFLEYLKIDRNFFFDNIEEWKEKFKFQLDYDKIIKEVNN